jgi:hypothetical protein
MRKVLLALVAGVVVVTTAASAATTQGQQGSAFRQDFVRFLTQMRPIASKLDSTGVARDRRDRRAALEKAIVIAKAATPAQLATLQRAMAAYPSWRTAPQTLSKLAARIPSGRLTPMSVKITADDCATARSWGYTQTDVEIAADAALAADAILEAIPDDVLSVEVRVAAVAIWAIPQGVLRGFEHLYNIAQACDDADHQALVQQNLDVKVSSRATQTSVSSLTTIVQDGVTNITNAITAVSNAIAALKTDIDNSFSAVTTQITNVQGGVDTANGKLDALSADVAANNALNIRLHIEEDLANPGNHAVGLFELPAAQGGYLGVARSIVADIIDKTSATGQSVGNAQSFLASGDQLRNASKFKDAYAAYGKAYQAATK